MYSNTSRILTHPWLDHVIVWIELAKLVNYAVVVFHRQVPCRHHWVMLVVQRDVVLALGGQKSKFEEAQVRKCKQPPHIVRLKHVLDLAVRTQKDTQVLNTYNGEKNEQNTKLGLATIIIFAF